MKTFDLVEDLSNITNISKSTLTKLYNKQSECIAHDIFENICEREKLTVINIGIGELCIKLQDEDILYKFIPNNVLENLISQVVTNNESPLMTEIEESLRNKVLNNYKELF